MAAAAATTRLTNPSVGAEVATKQDKPDHATVADGTATATRLSDDDHRDGPIPGVLVPLHTPLVSNTAPPGEGAGSVAAIPTATNSATTTTTVVEAMPLATAAEGSVINPRIRGGDDEKKDVAAAGGECDIGDGCQSSAERNIWSVFNPIWSTFVVKKARLPKSVDQGADWAGTAGKPGGLGMFLGLKNPVNRKYVVIWHEILVPPQYNSDYLSHARLAG